MWPIKEKSPADEPLTLKRRVEGFWDWFEGHAERFYATIEDKRCSDLTQEVSSEVDRWLPGMAWVFGPGEDGHGHSFTLSGEAVLTKQFVAEYWKLRAPVLRGWTFYASRQPSQSAGGFTIRLASGASFKPSEFWLSPYVNKQTEEIDIQIWHPSIAEVDESARFMALFLILDEILGEHGTQNWIGEIKFSEDRLRESIPILELPELIEEVRGSEEWKKYPPTETYSSYSCKDTDDDWLRGDTVAGTTRGFVPLRDYFKAKGPCEHPLPKLGVEYVFVVIPQSFFPEGKQVEARGKIEDAVLEELESEHSGTTLGGAAGHENCYLDFMLFDGEASLEILKRVLRRKNLPEGTAIHYFTDDKADRVIPV